MPRGKLTSAKLRALRAPVEVKLPPNWTPGLQQDAFLFYVLISNWGELLHVYKMIKAFVFDCRWDVCQKRVKLSTFALYSSHTAAGLD